MDELLENLLYGATFLEMDKWRRFSAAPEPAECVMRVFVCMELRLQRRYGVLELDRMAEARRLEQLVGSVRRKINVMGAQRMWSLLTSTLN